MGLARSVTKRFQRITDHSNSASKPQTERKERPKISLPIALISTTNKMTEEAPDITPQSDESASRPSTPTSSNGTPDLTDGSSTGSRSSSDSPSPSSSRHFSFATSNHLTQYFESADNKSPVSVEVVSASTESSPIPSRFSTNSLPPVIPRRAASHSKREHVRLARVRSVRSSGTFSTASRTTLASRHVSLENPSLNETHPFSRELAQLDEVQEDFNSILIPDEADLDEAWLAEEGYRKFSSSIYCDDLADLEASRFID